MVPRLSGDKTCLKALHFRSTTGCRRPGLCSDAANLLIGVAKGADSEIGVARRLRSSGNFGARRVMQMLAKDKAVETICIDT